MLAKPKIMGVINVTLDSYYENNRRPSPEAAIELGLRLAAEGADILDIGGESTNPKKTRRTPLAEELDHTIPVIQALATQTSLPISIDTMKWQVAEKAVKAGATIINDVSGFSDPQMREVAVSTQATLIVMHMPAKPYALQNPASYPNGVINSILQFLEQQVTLLTTAGVSEDKIILDPGFGGGMFGKSVADNLAILHNLHRIKVLGFPILVGLSRKTFIRETLGCTVEEALAGTIALNTMAVLQGADIIRVHDVKEHRDVVEMVTAVGRC